MTKNMQTKSAKILPEVPEIAINDYTKVEKAEEILREKEKREKKREKIKEASTNQRYVLGDAVARGLIEKMEA